MSAPSCTSAVQVAAVAKFSREDPNRSVMTSRPSFTPGSLNPAGRGDSGVVSLSWKSFETCPPHGASQSNTSNADAGADVMLAAVEDGVNTSA